MNKTKYENFTNKKILNYGTCESVYAGTGVHQNPQL